MSDWDIKTIVLGYDGSEGADKALGLASTLARQHKARVLVVNAYELRNPDTDGYRWADMQDNAREVAQKGVAGLAEAGVEAEAEVSDGPAGDVLLRTAKSRDADLIVVGRRGQGLIAELLLGSVSEYVVRRAKVPVLVAH
jgi:nucleotide-binding universal stress UspA family protein